MASAGKVSRVTNRRILILLLVLAICYQIFYQAFLMYMLPDSDECGAAEDSPVCREERVFKSWHQAELEGSKEHSESPDELERLATGNTIEPPPPSRIAQDEEPIIQRPVVTASGEPYRPLVFEWGKGLAELHGNVETRDKQLLKESHHAVSEANKVNVSVSAPVQNASNTTHWGEGLMAIMERLDEHKRHDSAWRKHFHGELARRADALDTQLNKVEDENHKWAAHLSESLGEYGKELCDDPRRNDYPACAQFRASDKPKAAKASTAPVSVAATSEVPQRKFLGKISDTTERLDWSKVKAWEKIRWNSSQTLISDSTDGLRKLKWHGPIPKVACVTAVSNPGDLHDLDVQLRDFVRFFKKVQYEGTKELVILYPAGDLDVSQVVFKHTDNTLIKAVPAAAGGHFPSTTVLRYGAWTTTADVIVRWNFDEWHHPERLSMQVRAMAQALRPVSILKRWTTLGKSGSAVLTSGVGWEGSLAGDAKWMRQHWMPLVAGERDILEGVQAHHIVQVDGADLLVYSENSENGWTDTLHHFGLAANVSNASPCSASMNGTKAETPPLDRDALELKLGSELARTYDSLVGQQHNVTTKLAELCANVTTEEDAGKREWISSQATRMSELHGEIKKHFDSMALLFHATDESNQ